MRIRDIFLFLLVGAFSSSVATAAGVAQGQALTFRVAGSTVTDASGANVGNIEALSIDPQSGQVMFAMVSLGFPADRTTVTPIPWQLIQHRSDARAAGGIPGTFQQFTVPFPQQTLRSAPQIDSQAMAGTADTSWMTRSSSFFAPLVAAGAANTAAGIQTGAGNSGANANAQGFVPTTANGLVATNFVAPTNAALAFTNRLFQSGGTNALAPGATTEGAVNPNRPAGTLPAGTLPAGALPPGTLPADQVPPGTVPNQGAALPTPTPTPRKVPLAPATPVAPAK